MTVCSLNDNPAQYNETPVVREPYLCDPSALGFTPRHSHFPATGEARESDLAARRDA